MSIQLQLEVTNVCNCACVFCTYPQMERPKGTMSMELFTKIVDEAATIPAVEMLTLTGLGETLLDRFLIKRLRYARAAFPKGVRLDLYTNGSYLRKTLIDDLVAAGLDVLYVSLNGATAEGRREVMKVDDYDHVVSQIRYAIARGEGRMKVVVKGIASKDLMEIGDHETFIDAWGGTTENGGRAFLHLEGNWAGRIGQAMRVKPKRSCHRALTQIMVLWDGRVSACCFDGFGEHILGDLNVQTLREMYSEPSPHFQFREMHATGRRSEIPICAGCTAI